MTLTTNDGTRADVSARVPDRHATGSPGAGEPNDTRLPAGVTLRRARNLFGLTGPGRWNVLDEGMPVGAVYRHASGGWEACRSFGVYVVDATATIPRDDVTGGFDRYPRRIDAVRALVKDAR